MQRDVNLNKRLADVIAGKAALRLYALTGVRGLASLPAGSGHWNSPIVVGGRVILPEGNYMSHDSSGVVDIYHLPGR